MKLAKYGFEFYIAQLRNTVIISCLHISYIGVQSLFCAILHNFPQASFLLGSALA